MKYCRKVNDTCQQEDTRAAEFAPGFLVAFKSTWDFRIVEACTVGGDDSSLFTPELPFQRAAEAVTIYFTCCAQETELCGLFTNDDFQQLPLDSAAGSRRSAKKRACGKHAFARRCLATFKGRPVVFGTPRCGAAPLPGGMKLTSERRSSPDSVRPAAKRKSVTTTSRGETPASANCQRAGRERWHFRKSCRRCDGGIQSCSFLV